MSFEQEVKDNSYMDDYGTDMICLDDALAIARKADSEIASRRAESEGMRADLEALWKQHCQTAQTMRANNGAFPAMTHDAFAIEIDTILRREYTP